MTDEARLKYLRWLLVALGVTFVFGTWPLMHFWSSGWGWGEVPGYLLQDPAAAARFTGMSYSPKMIIAVYEVLGVFLLLAAIKPRAYYSLISFTIWSSFAHAAVMAWMAFGDLSHHWGHLIGDVPGLFIVGGLLAWLCPQAFKLQFGDDGQTA